MGKNYSFQKKFEIKIKQSILALLLVFIAIFNNGKLQAQNFELVTVSSVSSGSNTNNALFVATSPTIPSLAFILAQRIAGPADGVFTQSGDNIRYRVTSATSGIPNNYSRIRFSFLQSDGVTPIPVNDFRFVINDIDGPNNEALATDCGSNVRFSATADPTNLVIDNIPPDLNAVGSQNETNGPTSRVMYEFNDVAIIEFDNYANNNYLKDFDMNNNDFPISTPLYAVCLGDADNDGVTDDIDLDDDNDGILDVVEAGGNDPNGDNDGDGLPNYLDTSDDTGASATYIANADGSVTDYTDANSDGVPDVYEASVDADSLPNHLDTDSDNDGCMDVDEVYGSGTDADADGQYGLGLPVVDANGLVIAAGVTGTTYNTLPSDNDLNGTDDYLQVSIAVTGITTQPVDAVVIPINNVTFNVVATTSGTGTAEQYQWQEQVNGVGSWVNLIDGAEFSGTTTNSLTISVLNSSHDGSLFRAVISTPSYACDVDQISTSALLTVTSNVIQANNDLGTATEGVASVAVANVLGNDDLAGSVPTTANVTLTEVSSTNVGVTLNTATGEINVTGTVPVGVYTLDYQICEVANPSNCSTATVTITVQVDTDGDGIPDITDPDDDNDGNPDGTDPNPLVPTAVNDSMNAVEGVATVYNIVTNDDYLPSATLSLTNLGTGTAGGTVSFDATTGEMTYTSLPGEAGTTVTLDYQVCNTAVAPIVCSTATVTITVLADNDGDGIPDIIDTDDDNDGNLDVTDPFPLTPTAIDDSTTILFNQSGTLNILINDDFLPTANTTITQTGGTAGGTVAFNSATGEMTYTPLVAEAGSVVTINYQVCYAIAVGDSAPGSCATAIVTITVPEASDLVMNKTVDNPTPNVGDNVVFTVTITNNGPNNATGVNIVDQLPSGYAYVSHVASVGTYDDASGSWVVGSIGNASNETLIITAKVNASGNYTNIAEVVSVVQADPNSIPGNGDPAENDQDEETTTPVSITDLITTKIVDNSTPNEGDTITYTLTVVNNGLSDATGVSLTDNLPIGLTYTSHLATGGTINTYTGGVWAVGNIASGSSATLTISALVNTGQGGNTITNIATAAVGNEVDPTNVGNDLTESITVTSSDLVTVKSVSNATPNEGDTITYTIEVTNNGPSDATGVSLVDNLPIGVSYVSDTGLGAYNNGSGEWTIGALASGSTATLTIDATVDAETSGDTITNFTTAAEGDQTDPTTTGDVLTAGITVSNDADIVLTKEVDNATPNTGDTVIYTITVTNNGPAVVTNLVVNDVLPAGLTEGLVTPSTGTWSSPNWTVPVLAVGATETMTIEATVDAGTGGQVLTNTVSNTQDQTDSNVFPDSSTATITVTSINLVTRKRVSPTRANEGSTIVYTITVANTSANTATNVSLTDLLPAGVSYVSDGGLGTYNSGSGIWTIGNILSGGAATLQITATVDAGTGGTTITNTTTAATGDQSDPTTAGDVLTASTIVFNDTDFVLTKVVDNATPNTGDTVTYTITVTNNGPTVVTNLVVNDALPAGLTEGLVTPSTGTWSSPNWTVPVLAVGGSETMTIEAVVTADGTAAQTAIVNTATHTQDQDDSSLPSEDSASIVVTASDLVTVKSVSNATPNEGDIITYTIEVTNNGPSDATGVSLVDNLPIGVTYVGHSTAEGVFNNGSGEWTIGALASGSTATLTIDATVDAETSGDTITNFTTAAEGDQTDPTTTGDVLTAGITVSNDADIVLTKEVDNATPNTGDTVIYTITVTNNGPAVVTNLVVNDVLPAGLTEGLVTPSTGTWSSPNWTVPVLAVGGSETMTIEAVVTADGTAAQTAIVNTSTHTQDQDDSSLPSEDSASIVVTASDLVTVKSVSNATPNEGDTITYTIEVTNNGPSDATGVSLVDNLPIGVSYVSDTGLGAYNNGSGEWTIGALASGSTATLTIDATVDAETSGDTIINFTTAAVGDQSDPGPGVDELEAPITVSNDADIVLTKVVDNATPNTGDTVTYTVTVRNNGPAKVIGLIVTDALPAGLTYGIVSPSDGIWTVPNWNVGTLELGEEETIVIEAVVGMDQGGQTLTNTVSNSQDQLDSNLTADDASETIVVTSSDLITVKTVSNSIPNEGEIITYTIAVTNNGPDTATNVSLIDNLPVGVTFVSYSTAEGTYNYGSGLWTIGNIANGATATLNITATVDDGTLGQTITNTTSAVIAEQSDPNPDNNSGSVSIVPTAYIDLSLSKTVVDDVVNPEVGDMITFEIRIDNEGPTEATGIQVTDIIPSGYDFVNYSSSIGTYNPITGLWSIDFIEIGNTAILLVDVIVMDSGEYVNCAEITATNEIDVDSTPNNGVSNGEDDYDCASAPPIQEVDLRIEKTVVADNLTPLVDTEVTFEIRLINDGGIEATEVIVTDLLPTGYTFLNYSSTRGTYDANSGIWNVGTIVDGETEILLIDAIVNTTGDYLNCATITEMHQIDPDLSNNTSCIATDPVSVADLELTKDVDAYEPYAEDNVDFTINLTNNGPSDATGVQVKDLLPSGYTFVSYSSTIGTYDNNSGLWNVGTIINGETETLVITAYVLPIGEWTNVAEVIAANELDLDSTPNNNDIYEDDQAEQKTEPIVPLTIPEGFSPNGDGINDVFEIEFLEVLYPNFSMEIVDRYGNKVYEYQHNGNPYQTPQWWDGYSTGRWNFSSDELPTGTYFFTIYFNNDERKPQTAWIYLRR